MSCSFRFLSFALLLSAAAGAVYGQGGSGVVEGWVFDPSGSPVPAAEIVLASAQTGQEQRTQTDETGKFLLPAVPVGEYALKVNKPGFKEAEVPGLRVLVGQRLSQVVRLELGAISESIVVTEKESALRETSSNELGTLIEPVAVQQLPLNGRNYLQLGYLSGAAQEAGSNASNFTATQTGHPDRTITIAGIQQDFTGYLVNGVSVSGTRIGQLALNVSVSAVDQFKVVQGFVLPSYGPDPGVVNLATRSGGSSLHGEAFEFHRNSAMDARDFFETRRQPGPFVRNQFGFALGGPLWPNRAFFFANYEGYRQRLSAPQGAFSPTAPMFAGDFRALPAAIYDPASYNAATGTRQPFPDRLVPETRINSVARRLLDYYLPGSDYNQRPLNVFRQPKQTQLADQGGVKIDVPLGNAGLLAGQYMQESSDITLPGVHPLTGVYYTLRMHLAGLQWTSNLDPRTVNVLQAGFTRPYLFYGGIGEAGLQQKLGITGTADQNGVPSVSLNGFSGFGAPQSVIGNIDNNYQLQETLTVMRGRHEIAAGAMLRYIRTVQESANWNARGTLLFSGVFTAQTALSPAGAPVPVAGTGSSFADFLLGLPVSGTVTSMPRTHYRWTEVHPFIQDTWRLRRDLTLNLGLSWYLATPPSPSGNDRNYPHAFDFNTGRILYAALGDIRPQIFSADRNNFSPRAGLAWQPRFWRGAVIRAAGGIYYPSQRALYLLFGITAPGVSIVQSIANDPSSSAPLYRLGHNIFPPISTGQITREFADRVSGAVFALDAGLRSTYSAQWNLSIQVPAGRSSIAEAAYIGSSTSRLPIRWNMNDCSRPDSLACDTSAIRWPRYPYVYFAANAGHATYHALNLKWQKEFSRGWNFLANYTWSKALSNTQQGGANPPLNQRGTCLDCDKGPTGFNVPHRLATAFVWDIPAGRGRRFLGSAPRLVDLAAGGWSLSVISTFATGIPVTVTAPNNTPSSLTNFRADRFCDGRRELSNRDPRSNGLFWLSPSCFAAPKPGYFGNSGVYILPGPGVANIDMALQKEIALKEAARLAVRFETFNTPNHTQFSAVNSMVGDANFGQVVQARTPRQIQIGMKLLW